MILRSASEAAQLGRRPEAEAVSEVSGLSPVTSESKHGQTRERSVSYNIHIYSLLGYPGVRSGVGNLIWKFESEDMRSKRDGLSEAERIRIGIS